MKRLVYIIQDYESDTFSASGRKLLRREAQVIAETLFDLLCLVVAEGGSFTCDGIKLSAMLDELRD